jgi:four helix bundle protein
LRCAHQASQQVSWDCREARDLARTRHFRDLIAWQKAMSLAREVYVLTEEFPKSEMFGLRMQLRRSAVSIASNIAEGHGRLTDPQLRNSLGMARGSLYELETQIQLACDLKLFDQQSAERLLCSGVEVAKLINGLLGVLGS